MIVFILISDTWKCYVRGDRWDFAPGIALGVAQAAATACQSRAVVVSAGEIVASYSYDPIARRATLDRDRA